MANMTKRRIQLSIVWDKDQPQDLIYSVRADAVVPDDKNEGGEERFVVQTDPQTISRATFRGLTGAQIQNQVINDVDAALQALGSGAGSHTLVDDVGDLS